MYLTRRGRSLSKSVAEKRAQGGEIGRGDATNRTDQREEVGKVTRDGYDRAKGRRILGASPCAFLVRRGSFASSQKLTPTTE